MRKPSLLLTVALLFVAGMTLAACDESEQGRITKYEPGKYQGQTDTQLTSEQRDALRRRMAGQSGS